MEGIPGGGGSVDIEVQIAVGKRGGQKYKILSQGMQSEVSKKSNYTYPVRGAVA